MSKSLTVKIDTATMVANILATWDRATPAQREAGATWYAEANTIAATLAAQGNTTIDHTAAVIAHLSPRTSWERNVSGATSLVLNGTAPMCIGANIDRARIALQSDDPIATINGPKTRAFAQNIIGDMDAVTVDIWALRVATGSSDLRIINRKGGYARVAEAYRIAAAAVGVSPATMQAATWIVARNGRAD